MYHDHSLQCKASLLKIPAWFREENRLTAAYLNSERVNSFFIQPYRKVFSLFLEDGTSVLVGWHGFFKTRPHFQWGLEQHLPEKCRESSISIPFDLSIRSWVYRVLQTIVLSFTEWSQLKTEKRLEFKIFFKFRIREHIFINQKTGYTNLDLQTEPPGAVAPQGPPGQGLLEEEGASEPANHHPSPRLPQRNHSARQRFDRFLYQVVQRYSWFVDLHSCNSCFSA